jgi:DNA-binding response OmpR family regulator
MRTVLLIESHGDTRDLYAQYLRSVGFRVRVAEATSGGDSPTGTDLDAVIVGMNRHDMEERMAFVRTLRKRPAADRLAIVCVGTGALALDEIRAQAAGCDVYLAKPCMPVDLACEVRHAILLRRRPRNQL